MTTDQPDGLPPLLSPERIEALAKPYIRTLGGDHWNSGDRGIEDNGDIEEFASAIESEVRAPLLAELAALRAEVDALRVDAGWRPISTIPRPVRALRTHSPGQWRVTEHLNRRALTKHWCVTRDLPPSEVEWLSNATGRRKRFKSEEAAKKALAAIDQSLGKQPATE